MFADLDSNIAVENVENVFDSASGFITNNRLMLNFAKIQAITYSLTKANANRVKLLAITFDSGNLS